MTIRPDQEAVKIEFNIYPKAKYEIYVYKVQVYGFTTTRISETEAIEILMPMLYNRPEDTHKYYYIKKTVDGKRRTIKTGINPKYIYKKLIA